MGAPRLRYLAPLGLWLAAAVSISVVEGTPEPPPAVALGSTALLHALRAAALFAIGLAAATVFAQAGAGRLPTQFSTSGLAYDPNETREDRDALARLQEQVDEQEVMIDRAAKRLDVLEESS